MNVWLAITMLQSISRMPLIPKIAMPGKTKSSSARQTSPIRKRMISNWSAVPLR